MTTSDGPTQDQQGHTQGEVVSAVLMTLSCPSVTPKPEERTHRIVTLSEELQQLGTASSWGEMRGALSGQPYGRMAEIIGLIAAAGEQLGLSYTCKLDGERWASSAPDKGDRLNHTMAARAFAEMSSYYSLGAAHALANATLRVIAIDPDSRLKLPPFDDQKKSWPSFGPAVTQAEGASGKVERPATTNLVSILRKLANDARWIALVGRRDTGYHRWRDQSTAGGVAKSNPWQEVQPRQHVLTLLGHSEHVPPEATAVLKESSDGLDALEAAARQWCDHLPDALKELGVPVFK